MKMQSLIQKTSIDGLNTRLAKGKDRISWGFHIFDQKGEKGVFFVCLFFKSTSHIILDIKKSFWTYLT